MAGRDDDLRALRLVAADWAQDLRAHALEVDEDPDAIHRHLDLPALRFLATMSADPERLADPLRINGRPYRVCRAVDYVVTFEELACGDAGLVLGAPGPALAGSMIDLLADEGQRAGFWDRLIDHPTWTFFALTEPERGSDAGSMRTSLTRRPGSPDLLLNGSKRYIGNAVRAEIGVVFARTAPGPLGITAVLVPTATPGFTARPLDAVGLRGLRLSAVDLHNVVVTPDMVLGRHLSAARRGLMTGIRMFNQLRPGVGAIALGVARAAIEYARLHPAELAAGGIEALDRLSDRVDGVRELLLRAAAAVDRDAGDGTLASAAKAQATRLAEKATRDVLDLFGAGARFDHPRLDKLARDAIGFEFMEGTSNIQKLNVFAGLAEGRLTH